jgi:CIC family chloride channel protein
LKPPAARLRWVALVQVLQDRGAQVRARAGRLLRRFLPSESQHLFALTIVVGVVCGLVAVAFHLSIRGAEALLINRALHAGDGWMAWTILSPTLGGLVAGAILTWVVPGARGSGIPQVKAAFALEGGRVRFRDAFGKFWLASMQIGAGASLGREGPTVQICAGATSLLARATGLPAKSARRLLPVGVAAGIAAAINAPIAAVTFTIEEIVGSLDHAVLSGVVVAAALAAVIERQVLGVHPVIEAPQAYALDHSSSLVFYAVLGVAGGLVSIAFTDGLLRLRAGFRTFTRLPRWAHPAVGGLVTGVLAVGVMHFFGAEGVTGGGYDTLSRALAGQLALKLLLALGAVKLVATVFSYSSGGAGGIFAPSLFIGSMLGGAVGYLDVAAFGHEQSQLGAFALVGMGAVFAGVVRAPITSVLIIFEMTGGYGLVLPLMLANMTSYILARHFRPTPIYEALLEQDGISLPRVTAAHAHPLDRLSVADAMTTEVLSASAGDTAGTLKALLDGRSFELVPVLGAGTLEGAVSLAALAQATPDTPLRSLVHPVETILSNVPLSQAVVRMNQKTGRQLVVLDAATPSRVVGMLTITDLVRAHASAAGKALPEHAASLAGGLEGAGVKDLAVRAPVVTAAASLDELVAALVGSPGGAVIVKGAEGKQGVVLLEHVREFLQDERMQSMLLAADLVRPAPRVDRDATLAQVLDSFVAARSEALVVEAAEEGGPGEVVTRTAVGELLVKWFANQGAD